MTSGSGMATERVVRNALRGHLFSDSGIQEMVEEFWVPRSNERADLVLIGQRLDGFEIETERDTLRRLPRQAVAYARRVRPVYRCGCREAPGSRDRAVARVVGYHRHSRRAEHSLRASPSPEGEPQHRHRDRRPATLARRSNDCAASLGRRPDQRSSRGSLWQELLESASPVQLQTIVRQAIIGRDPGQARIRTRRFTPQSIAAEAGS